MDWSALKAFISSYSHFVVTSHIHPDGDAVGSSLAMARLLHRLGKKADVILSDEPAPMYSTFHAPGEIAVYKAGETDLTPYDALLVVDVSSWDRLGTLGDALKNNGLPGACVDHHPSDDDVTPTVVRDIDASATACLICELVEEMAVPLDYPLAEAIYLGVMVDTQSFRLPNTNRQAHRVAAACLEAGIEPAKIYEPVYGTSPKRKLELLALALPTLSVYAEGKVATIHTTRKMYETSGACGDDDEGLVEYPRQIEGVEVAIFLREWDDGTVKVSWRSRDAYDIRESAIHFGGGGHVRASGAAIEGSIDAVRKEVIDEIVQRLFGEAVREETAQSSG